MRWRCSVLMTCLALASCTTGPDEIAVPSVRLVDPLGLADVVGDLRLVVFAGGDRSCATATGTLSPAAPDPIPNPFPEAVANVTFGPSARQELTLDEGTYTVLVRGRGIDRVSGRPNVIVATGCADNVVIGGGETRELTIELKDVVSTGVCGDGIVSPDEQCDGDTAGCMNCRTVAQPFGTEEDGTENNVRFGWSSGGRLIGGYDIDPSRATMRYMLLSENGETITSPGFLALDRSIDEDGVYEGTQALAAPSTNGSRFALGFVDFGTAATQGGDVRVLLMNQDRAHEGRAELLTESAGAQTDLDTAMLNDGTVMGVFLDTASATGASFNVIANGATNPAAVAASPIGDGAVSRVRVASRGNRFLVTFANAAGVFVQRFEGSGEAIDADPINIGPAGVSEVVLATLDDGRAMAAWNAGGTIQAQALSADLATMGDVITVGSGSVPSIGGAGERFLIAFQSGAEIRGRLYDGNGANALNRESPPTDGDFPIGNGTAPSVAAGGPGGNRAVVGWTDANVVQHRLFPLP